MSKILKAEKQGVGTFHAEFNLVDPSKESEIQFMGLLILFFSHSNSYLRSLFTNDFLQWVSGSIRDDFSPDLHSEYMADHGEMQKLRLSLESFAKNAEKEADAQQKVYEASVQSFMAENKILMEKAARWNERAEVLEKQLLEANWVNVEARNAANGNMEKITQLKATLWDMAERIAILEKRAKKEND